MKPIFTIHAGEYLVGSYIEKKYKKARVWIPSSDTGIDFLVTNEQLDRAVSLQVKFSKDFLGNDGGSNPFLETQLKSVGWWKFNVDKLRNSPADLWILVLYRFSYKDFDFVVIEPSELFTRYKKLDRTSEIIQSFVSVTERGKCWETRGLGKSDQESITIGTFNDPARDLSLYLNNWQPLTDKLNL